MTDVEFYGEIGTGRDSPFYQTTVTYKGRIKETIEFVAAKGVDKQRMDEITHALEIQNQMDHENIVHFIKWFQTDSKLFIVVEYCPGGTLEELLQRDVYLPESVIRIFAADILNALFYMHQNCYLFCDFDPRNILLDENGILKLSDFTGAVCVDEKLNLNLIKPNTIMYLAPELLTEDGIPSFASDLYSLACLMYQLACGSTPFDSDEQSLMLGKIANTEPHPLPHCSKEFNDLVLSLLRKSPYDRPTWPEVVKHPFWKDILEPEIFGDIDTVIFPKQITFENHRKAGKTPTSPPRLSQNIRMSQSLRVSQALKASQSLKASQVLKSSIKASQNIIIADSSEMEKVTPKDSENQNITQRLQNSLLRSTLLRPAPLVFNPQIEECVVKQVDGVAIPVNAQMLNAASALEFEKAAAKIRGSFDGIDRVKSKTPLINYLIINAKATQVATNFAGSSLFTELLQYAQSTKHPQLAASFLLLFGTIVRFAADIPSTSLTTDKLAPLEDLASSGNEIVIRRATAAFGEVVSYISQRGGQFSFPAHTNKLLLDSLGAADDITRHIGIRTMANVVVSTRSGELFKDNTIEKLLMGFDCGSSKFAAEAFGVCVVAFYRDRSPSSMNFVVNQSKSMLSSNDPSLQQLGILLSAQTNTLSATKDEFVPVLFNSVGELRIKAILAICLSLKNKFEDLSMISQRLFGSIDKMSGEAPSAFEAIVGWTIEVCADVVDAVCSGRAPCSALQTVVDSLSYRQLASKIWTPAFNKKVQALVKSNNYSTEGSELIVQIVQQSVIFGFADSRNIAAFGRALNSPREAVRFAAIKLISDSLENEATDAVVTFVEQTVVPLAAALLNDTSLIPDQTLKALARVSTVRPGIVSMLTKSSILTKIFQSAPENPSALVLSRELVRSCKISLDAAVGARIVSATMAAVDRSPSGMELLLDVIEWGQTHHDEAKGPSAQKKVIKVLNVLASKAAVCAARALENPVASPCLVAMIKLFTPAPGQNDVLVESAFGPFSISLTNGYKKADAYPALVPVLNALGAAAGQSQAMRLRLKGNAPLMAAVKKAVDHSQPPLREAAANMMKVVKG